MSEVDIENLEIQLADAQKSKELLKKWEKLTANKEFKELILEGFCTTNAARLVRASINPQLPQRVTDSMVENAKAAGYLTFYMDCEAADLRQKISNIEGLEQDLAHLRHLEAHGELPQESEED